MNKTICQLMEGNADNHMLPFFWQHGEDEATLRKYMAVIQEANCHAVCVESRPHPDFCGDKWWRDMDIILDEARKRNMKVWILDDSHFPTGFANGAMKDKPDSLCKQNIFLNQQVLGADSGVLSLDLRGAGLLELPQNVTAPPARVFCDDSILFVTAQNSNGEAIDLTDHVTNEILCWDKPAGEWTLQVGIRSRNMGGRRDYINVTEEDSCKVLIDAVYEPHWQHYADDFGKTIVGFFSDEPELGNGPTYAQGNLMGTEQDLPWGASMEATVSKALGENWRTLLPLLWNDGPDAPRVRSIYMDCLTRLVRQAFSCQLGDWCRDHGVQYIGHIIEDAGQHCRTGSSLGHYFRGLQGQDMAGIDNIGGQVLPQGEDDSRPYFLTDQSRQGEFYHYALAKLAQSAAAIEPGKHGNAMCEIFGNYGWAEGVRLEKYLADHFLVRGINQFVPHAFSPKEFPDQDCPPHFYAHGHNPQYRHFGEICAYMNRVATLTSSGKHVVPVAVLYHGESEWADSSAMPFEKPLRALYDIQIDCHVIPADIFTETEYYQVQLGNPLVVNGQSYFAFVVPETSALPAAAAKGLCELVNYGLPIYFVNKHPEQISETGSPLPEALAMLPVVQLSELADTVSGLGLSVPVVYPANNRIRILQIDGDTPVYFIVNEGTEDFNGTITFHEEGPCYLYDPWYNVCRSADADTVRAAVRVRLTVEPLKSVAVVFGPCDVPFTEPIVCAGEAVELTRWKRSTCQGIAYPDFGEVSLVNLSDNIAEEQPEFSGFARYESSIHISGNPTSVLEITDAAEGVEVFVNGRSLGIQIAPPFRYDITDSLKDGENRIVIEVATTLERQSYPLLNAIGKMVTKPPTCKTGLTGAVRLFSGSISNIVTKQAGIIGPTLTKAATQKT
ncbi:MAG: hypothetical protein IJ390_02405 [Lachnospiraceae bacterium]|nr:hypothetical protein [Lachnospiraceae bacterium]